MQRRMPHTGTQPPPRNRPSDSQPGPIGQAAAQLFRFLENLRQKGSRPDQDGPREAHRAGEASQREQTLAQPLLSGDEPREAPRCPRHVRHVRRRVGCLRCRTEPERGGHSRSIQVLATEHESSGGPSTRKRPAAGCAAQFECVGSNSDQQQREQVTPQYGHQYRILPATLFFLFLLSRLIQFTFTYFLQTYPYTYLGYFRCFSVVTWA